MGLGPEVPDMFGLPVETSLVVFGFPVFWILYTAGFLIASRHWRRDGDG